MKILSQDFFSKDSKILKKPTLSIFFSNSFKEKMLSILMFYFIATFSAFSVATLVRFYQVKA